LAAFKRGTTYSGGRSAGGASNRDRPELATDHDKADGHSFDEALLRRGVGRARLDEPFLFLWTNRNDDLVRRKGRKSVADGETDVRLPGTSIDRLAGKLLGRVFSDPLGMTDRCLVVGEPVEHALPYDRHHDLDRLGLPDVRAQHVVRMFDRADDEDVLAHELGASPSSTARKDVDQREEGDDDHSRDSDDGDGGSGEDHHR
jgi:hypothetical protein